MKRLLLSLCGVAVIGGVSFAQSTALGYHKDFKKKQTGDEQVFNWDNNASRLTSYTDTVWYDAFDDPNVWTINNQNNNGWEITTAAAGSTWYFANTDIQSTSGDPFALLVPDDPNNPSATLHTISTASPVDISGFSNQNLVLTYEKYGARFLDTLKVQVSNDATTWVTLDNNTDFPVLSTAGGSVTANPASRDLFIPTSIVNGNDLYIRFTWDADNANQPGIGYGWFIDDIGVFDVPNNDLVLDQQSWFAPSRLLYSWYYGVMPEEQAAADVITFSAEYSNRGANDADNAEFVMTVSGQDNQTFTSNAQNVNSGEVTEDSAAISAPYAPSNGIGTYTFTWSIQSDSIDDIPANNSISQDMVVSDNEFCMPPLPISAANIVGKGGTGGNQPYTLTQSYVFNVEDTLASMGVAFDSEWSNVGATFQLSVLDANDQIMTQTEIYVTEECMITDDMVYFPVPEVVIQPGAYDARLEVFSDSLFLVTCQDPIPPIEPAGGGGFFSRTTLSFGGSNFIEDMVYMSIRTKTNPNCNPNASVSILGLDTGTTGSAEVLGVSGLLDCVLSYEWTGPNGFSDDEAVIEDLTDSGSYTVVVTDANGCSATETVVLDITEPEVPDPSDWPEGISDLSDIDNVSLFPNPNNGSFNIKFANAEGAYEVNVINTLGQVVSSRQIAVSGNEQIVQFNDATIGKGVYTVSVRNMDSNQTGTQRIVVK